MRKPKDSQIYKLYGLEAEKISVHIKWRYIYDESNRWKLYISIDEMLFSKEFEKASANIAKAIEELRLRQGTDPNLYSFALMLDLQERKKDSSDRELAMDMNFDALVYLLWAIDESKGKKNATGGQLAFIIHLQSLRIKNDLIQKLKEMGSASIVDGKLPWSLKTGPINPRRITDALRQFDIEKANKKVVITSATTTNYLVNMRIHVLISKYWIRVKTLLERQYPEEFKIYEERWEARTNELLRKNGELLGLNSQSL